MNELAAEETATETRATGVKGFLREVRAEMKKVSWPNKKELIMHTGVVFVAVAIVGVLIWLSDTIFAKLLGVILR